MLDAVLPPEPTPVQGRQIDARCRILQDDEPLELMFNHSVLCQTSLPYRNPGDEARVWERDQGYVSLLVEAGRFKNPQTRQWEDVGLPYGARARLLLIHICTEALRAKSPVIEVEDSMTAFADRIGIATSGRDIKGLRDQMKRLSVCTLRLSMLTPHGMSQGVTPLFDKLDVFFPKHPRQRVLWPTKVQLGRAFFESLREHAVPLQAEAIGALKHSSSCLDTYQWLAQRLHRVSTRGQQITWKSLHAQLGGATKRVGKWKGSFVGNTQQEGTLPQVLRVYPEAEHAVEVTPAGLVLSKARPPVRTRQP